MALMTKLSEQPVAVTFVIDDKSPRPRIRIERGSWFDFEVMPPETFFKLCAQHWINHDEQTD